MAIPTQPAGPSAPFVDHRPEAVDLAEFDDLEGCQPSESRVGTPQPRRDGRGLDQSRQRVQEPADLGAQRLAVPRPEVLDALGLGLAGLAARRRKAA